MSTQFGCVGVVVDAKPGAIGYHERYGFVPPEAEAGLLGDRPEPLPMFILPQRHPDALTQAESGGQGDDLIHGGGGSVDPLIRHR